ncbi:flagellar export chaperone FlgN [Clostridium massiliamazoniense]|uniref:flagellar export chaperone FlgN n=1 Tax=Clostridium massiliamazoniense TaxID=1347366 RepID=UPI0006D7F128|nr:flagellar export chaperone FlgN [Clostridium massiliamazoniense]
MDLIVLKNIIDEESIGLKKLLKLLDKQYKLIMSNDPIEVESIVDEIKLCNKEIAELEVKRRRVLNGVSLKEIVFNSKDKELEELFREAKKLVELLKLQKESNELLLKQQISYNTKMLMILNPNRQAKTYNSYGRI